MTRFIYPDPKKNEAMKELDKIVEILQRPKNPELKKNIRILRNFSKALFKVVQKSKSEKPKKDYKLLHSISDMPIENQQKSHGLKKSIPNKIKETIPLAPPPAPPSPKPLQPQIKKVEDEISQKPISNLKKEDGQIIYDLVEPVMQTKDWEIFNDVKKTIKNNLIKSPEKLDDIKFLETEIEKSSKKLKVKTSKDYIKKIKYYLQKNLKGFGKIEPLIKDPRVKKIVCNSFNDIKLNFEDEVALPTTLNFDSNEELNNFIISLGEKYGKKVSESEPNLKLKLNNLEINANYSPITTSSFTITKYTS